MERKKALISIEQKKNILHIAIIYFLHLMGAFWYVTGYLGDLIHYLAGPFIVILGIYTLMILSDNFKRTKKLSAALLIGLMGYTLETVGWKTGYPYGEFEYSDILWPLIMGTPLAIAFAWITVTITSLYIARAVSSSLSIQVIICGLLALVLDIFMEPVAIKLGWWTWALGWPPITNYVTWALAAMLFAILLIISSHRFLPATSTQYRISSKSKVQTILPHVYMAQLIYFVLLGLLL
jgi:uncharacterized membrane protein